MSAIGMCLFTFAHVLRVWLTCIRRPYLPQSGFVYLQSALTESSFELLNQWFSKQVSHNSWVQKENIKTLIFNYLILILLYKVHYYYKRIVHVFEKVLGVRVQKFLLINWCKIKRMWQILPSSQCFSKYAWKITHQLCSCQHPTQTYNL